MSSLKAHTNGCTCIELVAIGPPTVILMTSCFLLFRLKINPQGYDTQNNRISCSQRFVCKALWTKDSSMATLTYVWGNHYIYDTKISSNCDMIEMMLLSWSPFTTIMGSFIASNMLLLYNGVSDQHIRSDSDLYIWCTNATIRSYKNCAS